MIKLKVNKAAEKFEATITHVESIDGKYGQEIIITWNIPQCPAGNTFHESYNIGSEMYGEATFERLAKFYSIFTGFLLEKDGALDPKKLVGKKAALTFAEKNGKRYISSKKPIEIEEEKILIGKEKGADLFDDEIPF